MSSPLIISGALANCGRDAPQAEFLQFLVEEAPGLTVFRRIPRHGRIMAAALDWQGVFGTGADIIAYAGVLWAAYQRFVKPRLRERAQGQSPFLFVRVGRPDGTSVQFSLGQEYESEEAFVEDFTRQVSELRLAGDDMTDTELLWEFSQREEWVPYHVRYGGHS